MRAWWIAGAVLLLTAGILPAAAGDYDDAEKPVDRIATWGQAQQFFHRYRRRIDGAVAEGYSDFVVHTLATRWSTLPELKRLTDRDPSFRKSIVQHIDATTDMGELAKVRDLATRRCPRGAGRLCREIAARARQAIADDARGRVPGPR